MTTALLIYDISHDGTRAKVADACLDYGLPRRGPTRLMREAGGG